MLCMLYDTINVIVDIVWSVCLEIRGSYFKPWAKQKCIHIDFLLGIFVCFLFLTIGNILGVVTVNETCGSYWNWDPKETWAFNT